MLLLNKDNYYNNNDINEAADLIYKMILFEPGERHRASECLEHPFLTENEFKKNISKILFVKLF